MSTINLNYMSTPGQREYAEICYDELVRMGFASKLNPDEDVVEALEDFICTGINIGCPKKITGIKYYLNDYKKTFMVSDEEKFEIEAWAEKIDAEDHVIQLEELLEKAKLRVKKADERIRLSTLLLV